jgi:hypothetical protein
VCGGRPPTPSPEAGVGGLSGLPGRGIAHISTETLGVVLKTQGGAQRTSAYGKKWRRRQVVSQGSRRQPQDGKVLPQCWGEQ